MVMLRRRIIDDFTSLKLWRLLSGILFVAMFYIYNTGHIGTHLKLVADFHLC